MPRPSNGQINERIARAALIAQIAERHRIEIIVSMMATDDPRRPGLLALLAA